MASLEQEERIKAIRNISKKVVAVGSCAISGLPASQRNTFTPEQKENIDFLVTKFGLASEVKKLSDVIKVDVEIPGCPMSPEIFLQKVNALVAELRP